MSRLRFEMISALHKPSSSLPLTPQLVLFQEILSATYLVKPCNFCLQAGLGFRVLGLRFRRLLVKIQRSRAQGFGFRWQRQSWNIPIPQAPERWRATLASDHPMSMFQLFGLNSHLGLLRPYPPPPKKSFLNVSCTSKCWGRSPA